MPLLFSEETGHNRLEGMDGTLDIFKLMDMSSRSMEWTKHQDLHNQRKERYRVTSIPASKKVEPKDNGEPVPDYRLCC